jgi:hypothetical protein
MKRHAASQCACALLSLLVAACGHHSSDGDKKVVANGRIFDPCVDMPQPGYDPKAQGLVACCTDTGPAHCVPKDQVNPNLVMALTACDDKSVCMPDPIIKGGGAYEPPSCTSSVGGAAGVCLSQCIPLVSGNKQTAFLGKDGCGDGELCIPCKSPLDGSDTGACEINAKICGTLDMSGAGVGGTAQCPYTGPPIIDPSTLPDCSPTCGGAHCLPASAVPTAQQSLLNACTAKDGSPGLCAPDPLIASGGNFVPKTCTSIAGSEGRCLSTCLPSIAGQANLLPKDVCGDGEKCAPCFNPTASDPTAPTGACSIACDKPANPPTLLTCPWTGPPVIDPSVLPACSPACGGAHCISKDYVPAAEQPLLAQCDGGKGFCAPDKIIAAGGNFVPKTCPSIAGVEGRCVSSCLPSVQAQASLLPTTGCEAGEVCAPCFNPTATDWQAPTGACSIGCDKPVNPPTQLTCPWTGPDVVKPGSFPPCSPSCGGAHCVPKSMVPQGQQAMLASCDNGNGLCAPDPIISTANHFVPKSCTSIAGAEGRCLSTCLPEIAAQANLLPGIGCADNERCAPCYNPTASDPTAPTGACSLGCDMPQQPPTVISCPYNGPPIVDPTQFENCASATCQNAHCLPAQFVPPAQQGMLAACADGQSFCTPDEIIGSVNHFVPKTCTSIAGAEGRCMSTCLPAVAAQAGLLPNIGCDGGTVCVPCFNPTASDPTAPTGACSLGCDAPTQPPVVLSCPWNGPAVIDPSKFNPCTPACGGAHCLPARFVPPAQRGLLASCDNGAGFCAPDPIIQNDNLFVPKTCTSIAGAEGRCLSTCLPMIAAQARFLPESTCATGEKCAPCFNPTALDPTAPTGACGLACDQPVKAPVILFCPWNGPDVIDPSNLDDCSPACSGAHCLPKYLVPPGSRGLLSQCAGGTGLCAPDPVIKKAGDYRPPTCAAFAGVPAAEGRCLSTCLPSVAAQTSLELSSCQTIERCAPCYNPIDGSVTGACSSSSCDIPAKPKYVFPGCCFRSNQTQGRCVPKTQVPPGDQGRLQQDACSSNIYLCVPNENLPGHRGQGCEVDVFGIKIYGGTCISRCVNVTGIGLIPQGNCPSDHSCVPCGQAPPNSPGC